MAFTLPPLPYAADALAPHISAPTLQIHHGKHHAAYVEKLNKLVEGTELAKATLEEVILTTARSRGTKNHGEIFNNAAQSWNHEFYWKSMIPGGGGKPSGALAKAIERDFGSVEDFAAAFKEAGVSQFGSGWAWLVSKDGALAVTKTADADLPLIHGQTALLAMDVWEHAYYLDYQNRRLDYASAFIDHLLNWDFAAANFKRAAAHAA